MNFTALLDKLNLTGFLDNFNFTEFITGLNITGFLNNLNFTELFNKLNITGFLDNLNFTELFNKLNITGLLDNITKFFNITGILDNITKFFNITGIIDNIIDFIKDFDISKLINITQIKEAIENAEKAILGMKSQTVVYANDLSVVYLNSKKMVITLRDYEANLVSGKTLHVVLNDKTYSGVTDSAGQISITVPKNLKPKTYYATVTFAGDLAYGSSIRDVKVVVAKGTPKLTAKSKAFKRTVKVKKFTITLKNHKNQVIKNAKVTIKVKGKTYTAKTNSKGKATFKITKLTKKGKYTAKVKFAGTKYFTGKTVKPKITIK